MTMRLFDHQRGAVIFSIAQRGGVALFHDPGLGKTRSALEIFLHRRATNPQLRLFVVCPLSLINAAWANDVARFTALTFSPFRTLRGAVPDVVAINYESIISKKILPRVIELLNKYNWMAALDESSRLKNHKSLTTKTLLALSGKFVFRLIASGTPMPNSPAELWGQINFVRPELLFKSFYAFRNTYFHLERNGKILHANGQLLHSAALRELLSTGWKYAITPEKQKQLMEKIAPVAHWVKKADALDLPDQVDELRDVNLDAAERRAYAGLKNQLVAEIGDVVIAAPMAITKVMKLREITSGFVYAPDGQALPIGASKLEVLAETLEQLGPQPIIVWAQFHYEIHAICKLISDTFGPDQVVTLFSETDNRDEAIDKFKTGAARYLVAHPKSAAHGLTFVNCSTMIFYSLDYSFEAHDQARNRIHRIGQNKKCLYVYLLARDTIDYNLLDVLRRKGSLQEEIAKIIKQGRARDNGRKQNIPAGIATNGGC